MTHITKVQCREMPTMSPRQEATATKVLTTVRTSPHAAPPCRSIVLDDGGRVFKVVDHDGRRFSVPVENVVAFVEAEVEAGAEPAQAPEAGAAFPERGDHVSAAPSPKAPRGRKGAAT